MVVGLISFQPQRSMGTKTPFSCGAYKISAQLNVFELAYASRPGTTHEGSSRTQRDDGQAWPAAHQFEPHLRWFPIGVHRDPFLSSRVAPLLYISALHDLVSSVLHSVLRSIVYC